MSNKDGTKTEETNRKTLQHWYNDMWAECNHTLVPEITAPIYLRHDITGAHNAMKAQDYSDMVALGTADHTVTDFSYNLIAEGDYVASMGRLVFHNDRQWDWVQIFRLENGKLTETWLPGMGGNDPFGVPQAWTTWDDKVIPNQNVIDSHNVIPNQNTQQKNCVRAWFENVWQSNDVDHLDQICTAEFKLHDLEKTNQVLSREELKSLISKQLTGTSISELALFMIEENDLVVAIASYQLTRADGEKVQHDISQAFRFEEGLICETWLPSIGGTDDSLNLGPHSMWPDGIIPGTIYRPKKPA